MNKKGQGLSDFFSVLAFALILIIFLLLLKLTVGNTTFELSTQSKNIGNYMSLLGILRTPIVVDNVGINIAELIILSKYDPLKKNLLEKNLLQIMDGSFGTSRCVIMCINGNELKGSGCGSLQTYTCPSTFIRIPTYDDKIVEISLEDDAQPLELQVQP